MSAHTSGASRSSLDRGHEQSDLSVRVLFAGLAVLVGVTALAVWAMAVMFGVLEGRQADLQVKVTPLVEVDVTAPEPRLETSPGELRDRIDALRETQGATYMWLDRQSGIARIPVSRAMAILAERGLPHRPAPERQP